MSGAHQPLEVVVTLFYPDCSNNNWATTADAINFLQQLVPRGFSGICHKVSEATTTRTPTGRKQWCAQNDLPVLGYHYVSTDDAAAQARTWLANQGGTEAMLDWETSSGDLTNLIAVVDAFNTAGITIQLGYYPRWYWNQQGGGDLSDLANALVSSGYPDGNCYAWTIYTNSNGVTGTGWAPYGGTTPDAWQFTDRADIAGLTVDCNAYQGTDLTVLFGVTAAVAPAPPAPAPQ
jgi:hypothetical protein